MPGDDVVSQRGTIRGWRNPSAVETARIVFVLLDATPATVDGEPLPDIHPAPRPDREMFGGGRVLTPASTYPARTVRSRGIVHAVAGLEEAA